MFMISVAMAAYNGEKYIKEQIMSILTQLKNNDEIVVSYNRSSDNTYQILEEISTKDDRVKVVECVQQGVLCNFENAIRHCSGDIIFLSDQDDVWLPRKTEIVLKHFEDERIGGVVHSCYLVDENLNIYSRERNARKSHMISPIEILIKNPVQGSCLSFRKKYVNDILPFPSNIPMHDSWIGLVISGDSELMYLDYPLIYYRQHKGQVTSRKHKKNFEMLKDRLFLLKAFLCRRL